MNGAIPILSSFPFTCHHGVISCLIKFSQFCLSLLNRILPKGPLASVFISSYLKEADSFESKHKATDVREENFYTAEDA